MIGYLEFVPYTNTDRPAGSNPVHEMPITGNPIDELTHAVLAALSMPDSAYLLVRRGGVSGPASVTPDPFGNSTTGTGLHPGDKIFLVTDPTTQRIISNVGGPADVFLHNGRVHGGPKGSFGAVYIEKTPVGNFGVTRVDLPIAPLKRRPAASFNPKRPA